MNTNKDSANDMNSNQPIINDMSDDDNDYLDDNTADVGFTEQTSDAAFYEQLPCENKNIICLTETDLKKVMDQILGKYSSCNDKVKKKSMQ